ncbi:H(+)/Cl(-) exchange transporter 7-like isoform X1 [Saccostrea echinata]|uniref:H(+)/Cl(-) exchange transporter 7-like isoform X1 n=1 Tax=Saccostrea echinata TaxID=191078 RepID=UPI002A809BEB|nr:H(+)/Cl(-) exchange transporter 7-like isoform X1 [Saccostrea echinata]
MASARLADPDTTESTNDISGTKSNDKHGKDTRYRKVKDEIKQVGSESKFHVTPVSEEEHELNNTVPARPTPELKFDIDDEADTLSNHNSITALLSSKFRDIQKRLKQYGIESPRFRKRLVSRWESMNYDVCENVLYLKDQEKYKSKKWVTLRWLSKWLVMFFIGLGTALLAATIYYVVEKLAHYKFELIQHYFDECAKNNCLYQPALLWMGINLVVTLAGASLVTFLQPLAAGSGIPYIKSYLNGIKIPGLLTFRAFVAKTVGVVLSILGGLACGKEGPMAHSGSIIAAGFGRGRINFCNGKTLSFYSVFRNDHEIRDFVAGGAASGVSSAFGAPIGGTLFSLEEAASFWNQDLTWRVFFSSMVACFATNFLISAINGDPTKLADPGLVRFNAFKFDLKFDLIEIPVFIFMAVIGGLTGALFVVMNYKLTVFRKRYLDKNWIKIIEAGLVAVVSAAVAFGLMVGVNECTDKAPFDSHAVTASVYCSDKKHNSLSTLFLTTPEGCLKALLHDPFESHGPVSLVAFILVFFLLGVWTYGLSVSSGVFIPCLAIGAAWGRLVGIGVANMMPENPNLAANSSLIKQLDVGKFALIGAACQLGGILRTTISLTVIIVECTDDISFGLPIMIVLMISKWVGDFITTGLYDMNVEVMGLPTLPFECPPLCDDLRASDVMNAPLATFKTKEKVENIYRMLKEETFCGFPVIEDDPRTPGKGKLKGLILRNQLLVLLKKKIFCPEGQVPPRNITIKDFRDFYPVYLKVSEIELSEEEMTYVMDLKPYYNPSPYTVEQKFSLPRVFNLFRGLGLRHLIVTDENNVPVGIVTRKDLAKFRVGSKRGLVKIEQLKIQDK